MQVEGQEGHRPTPVELLSKAQVRHPDSRRLEESLHVDEILCRFIGQNHDSPILMRAWLCTRLLAC